jgi:hypothetical protein
MVGRSGQGTRATPAGTGESTSYFTGGLQFSPGAGGKNKKFVKIFLDSSFGKAMAVVDTVPPEVVQQVAEYFDVLSEPMRLRILNVLRGRKMCSGAGRSHSNQSG